MSDINYIDPAEFRQAGYLHEVNRLLLHPLGLALSVETATERGFTMRLRAEDHENLVCELDGDVSAERLREILDGLLANGEAVSKGQYVGMGGVWDYRHDPEGIMFAGTTLDATNQAEAVADLWNARREARVKALGWMIQPVTGRSLHITSRLSRFSRRVQDRRWRFRPRRG